MQNAINFTHRRIVEDIVAEIISSYEKLCRTRIPLPIPVVEIAERLFHLRVDFEPLRTETGITCGLIIPDKRWMIINRHMATTRCNFTAAHELGHWLMDSRAPEMREYANLFSYSISKRDPAAGERLANYFAGVLLMPRNLLRIEAARHRELGILSLMSLSSRFGVSLDAMSIRLREIRDELDDSKISFGYSKLLENSEMPRSVQSIWPRTIVDINYAVLDHNLYRKLRSLKDQSHHLYVVWPPENPEIVETLLEFPCIDGFVSLGQNYVNPASRPPRSELSSRFVEIEYGLWLRNLDGMDVDNENEAVIYFPRGERQLSFLKKEIRNVDRFIEASHKLNYRKDAQKYIKDVKSAGKKVVLVTGCFDLVTNAHVRFLKRAKAAGDLLVVGIEADNRVRALKGKFRPVNTVAQRVELMNAFQFVDFTFVIHGSPKIQMKRFYTNLHCYLRADILAISQNDSDLQDRREEIEACGGVLAIVSQIEESSTTSLLRKLLAETALSDVVYISRFQVRNYLATNHSHWLQLGLPIDTESTE